MAPQDDLARLAALPLTDLAVEVMQKGFGPDGPADDGLPTVKMIMTAIVPDALRLDSGAMRELYDLIGEGVQVLEQAALVRGTYWNGTGGLYFTLTRRGHAALQGGDVAAALSVR